MHDDKSSDKVLIVTHLEDRRMAMIIPCTFFSSIGCFVIIGLYNNFSYVWDGTDWQLLGGNLLLKIFTQQGTAVELTSGVERS